MAPHFTYYQELPLPWISESSSTATNTDTDQKASLNQVLAHFSMKRGEKPDPSLRWNPDDVPYRYTKVFKLAQQQPALSRLGNSQGPVVQQPAPSPPYTHQSFTSPSSAIPVATTQQQQWMLDPTTAPNATPQHQQSWIAAPKYRFPTSSPHIPLPASHPSITDSLQRGLNALGTSSANAIDPEAFYSTPKPFSAREMQLLEKFFEREFALLREETTRCAYIDALLAADHSGVAKIEYGDSWWRANMQLSE